MEEVIDIEEYGVPLKQPKYKLRKNSCLLQIGEMSGNWKVLTRPLKKGKNWGAICECQCDMRIRNFRTFSELKFGSTLSCGCSKIFGRPLRDGIKKCCTCLKDKTKEEFHMCSSSRDGLSYKCKICQRIATILFKYNLTAEDYQIMLDSQDGKCKICSNNLDNFRHTHIDHCHNDSGKIRGILCHKCNVGLGHFNDNINLLESAISYLKENN